MEYTTGSLLAWPHKEIAMRNSMPSSSSSEFFPDVFQAFLRPIRQQLAEGIAGMDIDITETDGEYVLKAEIPGVSKEDLTVEVDDDTVTIRADKEQSKEVKDEGRTIQQERFWGQMKRTVSFSNPIDESGVKATYQNGLLTLTLPKKPGRENRKILIE